MSTNQVSFTVKSSHKFVNPPSEESSVSIPSSYQYSNIINTQQRPKGWTNNDTIRKEGSSKGMAIRTTNTSVEDFY